MVDAKTKKKKKAKAKQKERERDRGRAAVEGDPPAVRALNGLAADFPLDNKDEDSGGKGANGRGFGLDKGGRSGGGADQAGGRGRGMLRSPASEGWRMALVAGVGVVLGLLLMLGVEFLLGGALLGPSAYRDWAREYVPRGDAGLAAQVCKCCRAGVGSRVEGMEMGRRS